MAGDNTNIGLLQDINEKVGVISQNLVGSPPNDTQFSIQDLSGTYTILRFRAQPIEIAAQNSNRINFFLIALDSNTDTIWLNYGAPATAGLGSIPIEAGGSVELEIGEADQAISIFSETSNQSYTAKARLMV